MEKAIETILNQGVIGSVAIVFMIGVLHLFKYIIKIHAERLKEKDAFIERLSDNELKIAQIIASFNELKPVMEEIRELLKKYYQKSAGL